MQTLELLGAALGLGALSGLSLYLTVFVVGFSLHMQWLTLQPSLASLQVLAEPWIWIIALGFYVLEFFADKVPWLDSLWDAIHTLIRPIGAMFVAITVLGETHPVLGVLSALCAGGAAVSTHMTKSGARLLVNSSPEPFSNIGLSVLEDGVVVAGTLLTIHYPLYALLVVIIFVVAFFFFAPALFRVFKSYWAFVLGKLNVGKTATYELPTYLPHELDLALHRLLMPNEKVEWSIPCYSSKLSGVGSSVKGYLVKTNIQKRVYFVGKKMFREVMALVAAEPFRLEEQEKFLFDELIFYRETRLLAKFRFVKRFQLWRKLIFQNLNVVDKIPSALSNPSLVKN